MSRKYGTVHRQLRALTILDFLIQNAGERFLRGFADEPLLERLRIAATDPVSDPDVREKCKQLFGGWAAAYKNTRGMEGITALYKQLPKRKLPAQQAQAKVLREASHPDESTIPQPATPGAVGGPSDAVPSPKGAKRSSTSGILGSSSSSKKKKDSKRNSQQQTPFNLEKERPEILQVIASSSVASTGLLNALKLVNRETHRVGDDPDVMTQFERCKQLRRQILRYIQYIETGDLLGSLIHANEEVVTGLMAFEVLDRSVDYDSDSEAENNSHVHSLGDGFSGLKISPPQQPPRPARSTHGATVDAKASQQLGSVSESESEEEEDDDENNPFGDKHAVHTPAVERPQPTWYVVLKDIIFFL